jgi:hypothetical protein
MKLHEQTSLNWKNEAVKFNHAAVYVNEKILQASSIVMTIQFLMDDYSIFGD